MPELQADPGFISHDTGSLLDYDATAGEAMSSAFTHGLENNPVAFVGRAARRFTENLSADLGYQQRVSKADADAEVRARGLNLSIPEEGITRYELDSLQYLKQREIAANVTGARTRGTFQALAGFTGGLAAGAVDPINVASAFIPFVPEARYSAWLAQAGSSAFARGAVRAGAGALEGAAGAAVIEPISYAGAQLEQQDYGLEDSFMNVVFGSVLGGGLHTIGGAVYDYRVARALGPLDIGLRNLATNAPEGSTLAAFKQAVEALENDQPLQTERVFADTLPPERVEGVRGMGRTLADLIPEARADRGEDAFRRQFTDEPARAAEPRSTDERDIVSPIDRSASPETKADQLEALTAANKPVVKDMLASIDRDFGTKSMDNAKDRQKLIDKATRPATLQKRPWYGIEHIRDSYRFATLADDFSKVGDIIERVQGAGFRILKADTSQVTAPREFGWRAINVDLRAPNGQLMEYQIRARELHEAETGGAHKFYEKWRERDLSALTEAEQRAYRDDAMSSRMLYDDAWQAYLKRTGQDESAVLASAQSLSASAAGTGVKASSMSEPNRSGNPLNQDLPSVQAAKSPMTNFLGSPAARALEPNTAISPTSYAADIANPDRVVNTQISEAADRAAAAKELTTEDLAADQAIFDAHLDSLRTRGLLTPEDEAEIAAADAVATDLEARADAYEAALACDLEG